MDDTEKQFEKYTNAQLAFKLNELMLIYQEHSKRHHDVLLEQWAQVRDSDPPMALLMRLQKEQIDMSSDLLIVLSGIAHRLIKQPQNDANVHKDPITDIR